MTSEKRTAVCCLSSLNLDTYHEWKDTTWVKDMIRFLDNVLEYFVRLAPKDKLQRAIYSAKKERALGLGTLGYHSYLQRNNIAFESQEAASATYYLYKHIKDEASKESLQLALERGESPDCVGSGFRNSHLCVSGDTKILTKQGQKDIKSLVGKSVEVWNGEEWSNTVPFETGVSKLLKVSFSNGMELKCTPDHRFLIATPKRDTTEIGGLKLIEVEARMLRVGDCLPKFFTVANECDYELEHAYESGLFCGDGSISNAKAGKYPRKELRLYGDKMALAKDIKWKSSTTWGGEDCVRGYLPDSCLEKYVVPFGYSIASKTLWLCGLIDADGYSGSKGVSISMASRDFATRVALLVQELGGDVNVTEAQRTGGFSSQNTKYYVVGISMHSCNKIFKTITPKRVKVPVSGATRQQVGSYRMTEVTSIEYLPESEMTYCFTESKKGTGIFNGLLTKQCAIAPNASSADLLGVSPSREPLAGNGYNSQGRAGSFLIKNEHLVNLLEVKGYNDSTTWSSIIKNNGSVSHLDFLTDHEKNVYKAGKEINPMWIVELAAIAQEHICQGQSINIQVPNTITKQEMSDIHILAWKKGLKGLYYCRTEAAEKVDVGTGGDKPLNSVPVKFKIEYQECLSCSG